PTSAARWYRHAAEEALDANDLEAVLNRVQRGIACGASGEDLGVLRLVEAEAYLWRGELAGAEERGTQAVDLLAAGSADWFRAVYQVVIAAGKLGAFDRVERWAQRATSQLPARDARSARIICLAMSVTYLSFGGRYAAADALLDVIETA